MELTVENKTRNDLLSREEVTAIAKVDVTPKTDDVKAALSQQFGKDVELVVVKKIKGKFGSKEFLIEAYVYDNTEAVKKFEFLKKEKKEQPGTKQETGEKPEEKELKKEEKESKEGGKEEQENKEEKQEVKQEAKNE